MAAPSGTIWGSAVQGSKTGRQGKIGVYTSVTNTNTQTTVNVQVWFWTIYTCEDGTNNFYCDIGTAVTSATTKIGSKNISHPTNTGSGWSTNNQTKLYDVTKTYTRGTSAATYKVYAKYNGIDMLPSKTMYVNTSFTVPALASYTISYNVNGGSGAPSSQTKYYGKTLTLSSTKPTRTGYSFLGWSTSSSATSATYTAGASYTGNANATLYAIWKANTYDVTFNANGGSGAPAKQTKTYGVTLTLSSVKPTRANYNFLGWATSASATTATYKAGASYTANSDATLYAVWELAYVKPAVKIESLTLIRSDDTNEVNSCEMSFSWACMDGYIPNAMDVSWVSANDDGAWSISEVDLGSGVFTQTGSDAVYIVHQFDPEATYTFTLTVHDSVGSNAAVKMMSGIPYTIDCLKGGKGIAFGKSAELTGVADIGFKTRLLGGMLPVVLEPETDLDDVITPNTYIGANLTDYNYSCTSSGGLPFSTGTFSLEVVGMGEDGQIKQRLTYCHKTTSRAWERFYHSTNGVMSWGDWVCVSDFDGQLLWQGGLYMQASHTINLSEPVSKQRSGIVLVFSEYFEGEIKDYGFSTFYIPKHTISKHGDGTGNTYNFVMSGGLFGYIACKNLYITDTYIKGHEFNTQTGTGESGITYDNKKFVLRYVIGI